MTLSLNNYQLGAESTAQYPGTGSLTGLLYVTLGLTGEAGEIANKVKKIIRDNNGEISYEMYADLRAEAGDVLWYLAQLATELDVSLSDIAEANLVKLADRHARNVIGGSGDNR